VRLKSIWGTKCLSYAVNTNGKGVQDMALLRRLRVAYPSVVQILLVESADRDLAVNAFRSGVRGLFCFGKSPFRLLCKCIQIVHKGQIWARA
jgi:DNA-binding NarL/FixJ family response regulator